MTVLSSLMVRLGLDSSEFVGGVEDAISATDELDSRGGGMLQAIEDNWLKVGAAATTAGAGLEALARRQAPMTEQSRRLAASLGMTEDEVRGMATSMSNATFPLESVLNLMESGRQQGLRTAEDLERFATFWDMIGDATGESADRLGDAGVALRAVGIAAGSEHEALAAFGFVTEHTTGSVGDLLTFLERTGPQLREMGMDVNDAAAVLGVLENEMGMTGRMARQEFRKAVNDADGDVTELMRSLGIGADQFSRYRDQVDASSGVIERNSDIHAGTKTVMEEVQSRLQDFIYQNGALFETLSMLTPVLLAVGPIMGGIAGGVRLVSGALALLSANPLLLLGAAVVALGVLIWVFRDDIAEVLGQVWDFITGVFGNVTEFVGDWGRRLWDFLSEWHPLAIMLRLARQVAPEVLNFLGGLPGRIIDTLGELPGRVFQFLWDHSPAVILLRAGRETVGEFLGWVRDLPGRIVGAIPNPLNLLYQVGRDIIDGLWKGMRDIWGNVTGWVSGAASSVGGMFRSALGIFSPSRVMMDIGGHVSEGFFLGIEDEWDRGLRELSRSAGHLGDVLDAAVPAPSAARALTPAAADGRPMTVVLQLGEHELGRWVVTRDELERGGAMIRTGTAGALA